MEPLYVIREDYSKYEVASRCLKRYTILVLDPRDLILFAPLNSTSETLFQQFDHGHFYTVATD